MLTLLKDCPAKTHSSLQVHMSWYYYKSIIWGDNSNFIANFKNKCAVEVLKDTIIISQDIISFQGKYLWQSYVLAKYLSLRFTVTLLMITKIFIFWNFTQASSEPSRTSQIGHLAKTADSWKQIAIFLQKSTS